MRDRPSHDTDESSRFHDALPYLIHEYFHHRLTRRTVEIIPLFILLVIPFTVQVGVVSAFFNTDNSVSYMRASDVSMAYPAEAAMLSSYNSATDGAQGGGDMILDDGVLVASGPYGADQVASGAVGEITLYAVREGDTLSQIAEMFEVNSNTILWANDLNSAADIHPGDTLVILPIVGVRHIVKEGDTIASIAAKYEGQEAEILEYNRIASLDEVSAGATLVIPGGNLHKPATKAVENVAASTVARSTPAAVSAGGGFVHPVPGAVRTQGIHGYNAVDLAAPNGTAIRAASAGEVIVSKSSGWNGGYGNYVVIRHGNGAQTLYAHMSANYMGVGAIVAAGETIGAVGNTGRSTGDHLHFEVRGAQNPF